MRVSKTSCRLDLLLLAALLSGCCVAASSHSEAASRRLMQSSVTETPYERPVRWATTGISQEDVAAAQAVASDFNQDAIIGLKPRYHITPPDNGWLNDPTGMFQSTMGVYHIFYQLNPADPVWGAPYWGHVASADFVHWEQLPPAIAPDTFYDYDGAFSGSTTLLDDGTPAILYTGVSNRTELGYFYQVQALATPANMSDPELKRWVKARENPVMAVPPPGAEDASQWRDPTTAWRWVGDNSTWYTAIGTLQHCVGSASLYSSRDFKNWTYEGPLFTQLGLGGEGECRAPPNGVCDQFGEECRMWECPDIFEIGDEGLYVFKYSDQVKARGYFGLDFYILGNRALDLAATAGPDNLALGAYQPLLDNQPYPERLIDYGPIYASKTFQLNDGRRIWLGWVYETATGCNEMCSPGTPFTDAMGWQGILTLPREITYDPAIRELRFNPVPEVEALRTEVLYDDRLDLPSSSQETVIRPYSNVSIEDAPDGRQMELLANFTLFAPSASLFAEAASRGVAAASAGNNSGSSSAARGNFVVGMTIMAGPTSRTRIGLRGSATVDPATLGVTVTEIEIFADRNETGGATNVTAPGVGGNITLPQGGVGGGSLSLHVFVDHSLIEAFALEGRGRLTSRIYPASDESEWGVALFGHFEMAAVLGGPGAAVVGTVAADAMLYELESCWIDKLVV